MNNESCFNRSQSCPFFEKCPFFNDLQGRCKNLANKLKKTYCCNDNSRCARFHIRQTLGSEHVPPSMMPQQWEWANMILVDAGKTCAVRDPQEMMIDDQS